MSRVAAALLLLLGASASEADDWAQFQGPRGDGTSPEQKLLRAWPADGPKVLWRARIKMGWSSPSVSQGEVFVAWTEAVNGGSETIACLDAATGQQKWKYTYEVGPYWKRNIGWAAGGFRSTPAVDDRFVFALGAIGHLHCLNRRTGAVVWMKNLWDEWIPGEKGYSTSPMLANGKLILYLGNVRPVEKDDQSVIHARALDPATGKVVWTFTEPHQPPARGGEGQTPAITKLFGKTCALFTGNCSLIALSVDDGKPLWRCRSTRTDARGTTIPTPLVMGRLMFNIPDLDVPHAVQFDPAHPDVPGKIAWKQDLHMFTALHMFRPSGEFLYGFAGSLEGSSDMAASKCMMNLVCLEAATGKVRWSEPGFRQGISLTEADGLLFVRSYQTLHLIEATPAGCRRLGEIKTHDNRMPTLNLVDMVMPVLCKGRLYVRVVDELICFNVAAK